jgi:putative membrane-bound dehydrogenase-like protein
MSRPSDSASACLLVLAACTCVCGQDAPPKLRVSVNVPSLNVAEGLELDQLLQEPQVANPLYLNFDERGRLWVVQFRQYPWPAGLKLISRDNVWRNVYQPPFAPPPPHDEQSPFRGKDTITIHEDTDGDGVFDQHKTFLDGLNLATAALKGRGGVFVMNPPYLVFYADRDDNDVPDSLQPQVLLSGFGIEDTHSICNSLRWGPDGWIYGTQGSTVSAAVVRHDKDGQPIAGEQPVNSMGQNVWRYHPEQHRYEVFAEGGGNAFGVEFDSAGRVYSGHNGGDTRGFHYVPGGYYLKNFGKHGLHSNPFTFAYFGSMRHHAVERFTHAFEIYEADALPAQYRGHLISVSPILHYVMTSTISADGSTRLTRDRGPIVTAGKNEKDNWFTPVDIQTGPDGALYIADWHSMQSNHYRNHEGQTNPDLGRVYRVRGEAQQGFPIFDLRTVSSGELIERYLAHPNRWFRETALRLLGDRHDPTAIPQLRPLAADDLNPHAVEALWALHLCEGLDDAMGQRLLGHAQAPVRSWTIRLLADQGNLSPALAERITQLAVTDPDVEVRLQIACSARRLPTDLALAILSNLLTHAKDAQDPFLPNTIWWGVEAHAHNHAEMRQWLRNTEIWQSPVTTSARLLENLMRRFATLGTRDDLLMCAELLQRSPDAQWTTRLVDGFSKAFEGRSIPQLPTELVAQLSQVEGRFATLLGIRRGEEVAIAAAFERIQDDSVTVEERVQLIRALGEVHAQPDVAVPIFQRILHSSSNESLTTGCLGALQGYDQASVGQTIVELFPGMSPTVQETAQSVLASRKVWSQQLLDAIDGGKIPARLISPGTISRLSWHHDPHLQAVVAKHFASTEEDSSLLDLRMELVEKIALSGNGNPLEGQKLYHESAACGKCHQMFGKGGAVGPDLTSYNRSNLRTMLLGIINPNAEIREGFETLIILTDDGQVINGFKIDEDANSLVLRTVDGQSQTINKASIEEQHRNNTSLMPTGLLNDLSDTQIRDLFAFLTSTTPPN